MHKKTILGLALIPLGLTALFGQIAHAQNGVPTQSRLERMAAKLNMTPQQESQAKALIAKAFAQAQIIQSNRSLTAEQQRTQIAALKRTTRRQIAALLTPTQRQEARQRSHQKMAQKMERMADKLGLTPSQRTQIQSILASGMQQAQSVHQNTSLTADQRHTQTRAIMQSTRQQALAVLTPAQRERWEALKSQWRQKVADTAR